MQVKNSLKFTMCEYCTIRTSFQCWKVFSPISQYPFKCSISHILSTNNQICAEKCEDCAGGEEVVLCRSVDGDDQVDHHEAVADVLVQGRVGRSG